MRGLRIRPAEDAGMRVSNVCSRNQREKRVLPAKLGSSQSQILFPPHNADLVTRRIRSLESHVSDIRQTQVTIQTTLNEIVSHLRNSAAQSHRSPSVYHQQPFVQQSPSSQSHGSPATSTPGSVPHPHPPQLLVDTHSSPAVGTPGHAPMSSVMGPGMARHPGSYHQSSSMPAPTHRPSHSGEMYPNQQPANSPYSQSNPNQSYMSGSHQSVLPPFSSIESSGSSQPNNVSSVRYHEAARTQHIRAEGSSNLKRPMPQSNVTSADSTDNDEDEDGELPASGLVAPWEVLRGLADVAVQQASKVTCFCNLALHPANMITGEWR